MKIEGLIVALLTPFHADGTLNFEAADQLVDRLIDQGVEGLFVLGTNGEFHVLSQDEKVAYATHVIEYCHKRVPVYVGVGCNGTQETVELARKMAKTGAAALSVINPYFLNITQDELEAHYRTVAAAVDCPIILYNIPKNTGMNIDPLTFERLLDVENIVGIKDSSGNMDNLSGYVKAAAGREISVLVGSDSKIYQAYALGASGVVAGTANIICAHDLKLIKAFRAGDFAAAEQYQNDIEVLRAVLKLGSVPSVFKRLITLTGIDIGAGRLPVQPLSEQYDDQLQAVIKFYNLASHNN